MTKIAICKSYGGFYLPEKLFSLYNKKGGKECHEGDIKRNCPSLIEAIEEYKKDPEYRDNGVCVIEIPDNVEWQIEEYDSKEWVAEKHRTWGK